MFSLNLDGRPKESVLYDFQGDSDGSNPVGITLDKAGSILYGTTQYGESYNEGTVFEFVQGGNSWNKSVLHDFSGGYSDGAYPLTRPIMDKTTGGLYGTTPEGGQHGSGTVWTVSP